MDNNSQPARGDITRLLTGSRDSQQSITDELLPLVYQELKLMARSKLARERPGQTLTPTALVHDVYLRLIGDQEIDWQSRRHFFAAASEAMRRILIDAARRKSTVRHGGQWQRSEASPENCGSETDVLELLEIDQALTRLQTLDQGMAEIVSLRYFGGMTMQQIAQVQDCSERTVHRRWTQARAWMTQQIAAVQGESSDSADRHKPIAPQF